ncbi:hypothetical protein LSAT2_004607 [Lamellibrachia satsuma]|nr:hypothetical protein LSAT2_004607 [Lamellibrachia satsuma]
MRIRLLFVTPAYHTRIDSGNKATVIAEELSSIMQFAIVTVLAVVAVCAYAKPIAIESGGGGGGGDGGRGGFGVGFGRGFGGGFGGAGLVIKGVVEGGGGSAAS